MKKKILLGLGVFLMATITFSNVHFGIVKGDSSELSINAICKANEAQAECTYPCEPIFTSCCWAPYNAVLYSK